MPCGLNAPSVGPVASGRLSSLVSMSLTSALLAALGPLAGLGALTRLGPLAGLGAAAGLRVQAQAPLDRAQPAEQLVELPDQHHLTPPAADLVRRAAADDCTRPHGLEEVGAGR